jgi:hypothetical protein
VLDRQCHDATKIAARDGGTRTEQHLAEMVDSENGLGFNRGCGFVLDCGYGYKYLKNIFFRDLLNLNIIIV